MNFRRGLLLLAGVLAVIMPRRVLDLQARINTIGFDGTESLTPQHWMVTVTRLLGLAAIVFVIVRAGDGIDAEDSLEDAGNQLV